MNIKIKKLSGNIYTKEDRFSVSFDDAGASNIRSVVYSLKVVSGVETTHGGGGEAGEWLNYATDEKTQVEYAAEINVAQSEEGTSTIKIIAQVKQATDEELEQYDIDLNAWELARLDESLKPADPVIETILESVETTVEWSEDTYN